MWSPKIQRLRNVVLRRKARAFLKTLNKVAEEAHTPNDEMVAEAKRGLAWRKEFNRGGTEVGVARARDISNRKSLPVSTIKRMHSYFSRHAIDKDGEGFYEGDKGYPSAGRIAWALWGGDAGRAWVNKILGHHDKESAVDIVSGDSTHKGPSAEDRANNMAFGQSPGNAGDSYSRVTTSTPPDAYRNANLDKVASAIVNAYDKMSSRGVSLNDIASSGRGSKPFNGPRDESLTGDSSAKIGVDKDSKVNEPYTNNLGHDSSRFDDKMNIVKGADDESDRVAVGLPDQGVDENKYGNDYGRADMAIPRPHKTERMKYRK